MLQMVEKDINWYAKANDKYTKDYNQNKESSYIMF